MPPPRWFLLRTSFPRLVPRRVRESRIVQPVPRYRIAPSSLPRPTIYRQKSAAPGGRQKLSWVRRSYNRETFLCGRQYFNKGETYSVSIPWLSLPGRFFYAEDILTWHAHGRVMKSVSMRGAFSVSECLLLKPPQTHTLAVMLASCSGCFMTQPVGWKPSCWLSPVYT